MSCDVAFGGGLETMRDGTKGNVIWEVIDSETKYALPSIYPENELNGQPFRTVGCLQHIPWAMPLLFKLPMVVKTIEAVRSFSHDTVQWRKSTGSPSKDIYHYLVCDNHQSYFLPAKFILER